MGTLPMNKLRVFTDILTVVIIIAVLAAAGGFILRALSLIHI